MNSNLGELSPYFIRRESDAGLATGHAASGVQETGLHDCWVIIRSHRRLIGMSLLGALAFTALVVFNLTPLYTAQSTLLLESQMPRILDTTEPATVPQPLPDHDYYKTQYDILRSRSLAANVITELNLAQQPLFDSADKSKGLISGWWTSFRNGLRDLFEGSAEPIESFGPFGVPSAVIDQYLARLEIKPRFGTQLVVVSFTTPDPELSARIVNAHVNAYIRRCMELKAETARNAEQFLSGKLAELKDRVEKSEAALNAYRREHGVIAFSLSENSKGQMLEERLTDLNNTLAKIEAERIALETQDELIRNGEADALPAVMQNQLIQNLKQQVAQLAAQYAAMSNQFNPGYYQPLDSLKAKLDQSRTQLALEIGRAAHEVESDYRAVTARERMLEQEIASVKSEALALNDASLQDAVLVREVDASRNLYKSVLERVRELDVSADAPASNVSVVDRAAPPRFPSSPQKLFSLAMSAFLGLLGGVAFAFLREFFGDRIRSSEGVERALGLPTLALVPDFKQRIHRGYGLLPGKMKKDDALAEVGMNKPASRAMVVPSKGQTAAGEIYHVIRTALLFSQPGSAPKSVLITSAVENEGKTVTALNVALAFAETGVRVLLVDADLRKGRCHEILGVQARCGLSDVLTGQKQPEEVILKTPLGFWFLSLGGSCPNPAAILGSGAMRDVLACLCKEYDHVLIDSPPLLPVSDAAALAPLVDGVLMVVEASTSKRTVRQAYARLAHVGAKVFGVALNRVNSASPDYYYYNPDSYYYRNHPAS
jgi:succinoglycan biosynthesis transport protein ExoP